MTKHCLYCGFVFIDITYSCNRCYPVAGILAGCAAVIYLHVLCALVKHNIPVMRAMERLKESNIPAWILSEKIVIFRQTQLRPCRIVTDYRDLRGLLGMSQMMKCFVPI